MDLNLPHRRYNPLTREWVLVSPHRAQRPWLGQVEKAPQENLPDYDPTCYLCPRNARAGQQHNPDYTSTFVFDNDFPALLKPEEAPSTDDSTNVSPFAFHDSLLIAEPEFGLCRVVCFSPRHDLSLPELSQAEVETVVRTWIDQTYILATQDFVRYVQVFENKGAMMGASNPHPHSQVWATSHIPNEPARELIAQTEYLSQRESCLLCDTLAAGKGTGERVVVANEQFTALVPFWAVWPFEVLLLANRHIPALTSLETDEIASLADIIRRLTARYDNLFEISFPYSMGFHQAPVNGSEYPEWHLHAHFYPPLLRSANVRKFMVGFEMLATPQRDLTPELAAQRLRSLGDQHYRRKI